MKKLSIISDQIKNNSFSYTGKGSFESVVQNNKDQIIKWLEELLPLQQQIDILSQLSGLVFQKRNYTRILTKLYPNEYTQFVSLNILVRDSKVIAQYYEDEYNITTLYENLIKNKYLKYPGKYDKYVDFNIFQKFIMIYRDELKVNLDTNHQQQNIQQINSNQFEDKTTIDKEETKQQNNNDKQKETNWTQLLLGKRK